MSAKFFDIVSTEAYDDNRLDEDSAEYILNNPEYINDMNESLNEAIENVNDTIKILNILERNKDNISTEALSIANDSVLRNIKRTMVSMEGFNVVSVSMEGIIDNIVAFLRKLIDSIISAFKFIGEKIMAFFRMLSKDYSSGKTNATINNIKEKVKEDIREGKGKTPSKAVDKDKAEKNESESSTDHEEVMTCYINNVGGFIDLLDRMNCGFKTIDRYAIEKLLSNCEMNLVQVEMYYHSYYDMTEKIIPSVGRFSSQLASANDLDKDNRSEFIAKMEANALKNIIDLNETTEKELIDKCFDKPDSGGVNTDINKILNDRIPDVKNTKLLSSITATKFVGRMSSVIMYAHNRKMDNFNSGEAKTFDFIYGNFLEEGGLFLGYRGYAREIENEGVPVLDREDLDAIMEKVSHVRDMAISKTLKMEELFKEMDRLEGINMSAYEIDTKKSSRNPSSDEFKKLKLSYITEMLGYVKTIRSMNIAVLFNTLRDINSSITAVIDYASILTGNEAT